jgi:hypothetical protein
MQGAENSHKKLSCTGLIEEKTQEERLSRWSMWQSEIKAPLSALHNPQPPLSGAEERAKRPFDRKKMDCARRALPGALDPKTWYAGCRVGSCFNCECTFCVPFYRREQPTKQQSAGASTPTALGITPKSMNGSRLNFTIASE